MTLFEYISVATSLILSFSLARTLTNIAPIFASERRYWVHSGWILGLLFFHITLFWQLWVFQTVVDWTLFKFLVLLLGPFMLLIGVSLLVPTEPVSDFQQYFDSMRRPFYSILVVMQLQPVLAIYLLFDLPTVFHTIFISNLFFAVAAVTGLILRKAVIDKTLVVIFVLGILSGLISINDHDAMTESFRNLIR